MRPSSPTCKSHGITTLSLSGHHEITNDGMKAFENFYELQNLDLSSTGVRDEGLAHLSRLTNLESLDLSHTIKGDR